jgi:hypothetical protein
LAALLEVCGLLPAIILALICSLIFAAGARAFSWPRDAASNLFANLCERLSDRLDDLRAG